VVQIDLAEDTWGQQRNFRINTSDDGSYIRKAYVEFTLPKIGTFTVGKQPVVLGYGLVLSDSSGLLDGVKWSNKWGPIGVSAMYFKGDDNVTEGVYSEVYNSDGDMWLLDLVYTPNENHTIELFGGYVDARTGYPMSHEEAYWVKINPWWDNDEVHSNVGFVGIAYTGEIANMISLKGEFSYLFGRADFSGMGDSTHARLSGYNLYLDASWHNDLMRVGLAFVHGSGQTNDGWGAEHYNANFIVADEFIFGNIIASGNGGLNDTFGTGLGFCNDIENLTALTLYFESSPMEKLSINAAVIWARWTEPVGYATNYYHPASYYSDITIESWYPHEKDLGWEIDLGLSYEIMEGLPYTFAGGVLLTGDSFDYVGDGKTHENWGPIWMINNELKYEF